MAARFPESSAPTQPATPASHSSESTPRRTLEAAAETGPTHDPATLRDAASRIGAKTPGFSKARAANNAAGRFVVAAMDRDPSLKLEDALNMAAAAGHQVDILRDIVGGMGPHGADLHDVAVSELMTQNIIHCTPQDSVNKAMALMTDRRIRHLPVFDGDDLVGFISIGDLVKCRILEVQAEAEAMRQYISS